MKQARYYLCFAVLLLAVGSAKAQEEPEASLTHAWTFDDGTPADVVGDADGTLIGEAEIVDGTLLISATNQWLELPAEVIAINEYEEITLEVLYTPNLASGTPGGNTDFTMLVYFGGTNASAQGINYLFMSTARGDAVSRTAMSVGVETNPWSGESGVNGPEFDDVELHHMVSTIASGEITLYLDGELIGTTELASNNVIEGISTDQAYLARGGYTADPAWLGGIHEFRIYNRALTSEEVAARYAVSTDVEDVDESGMPQIFSLSQNYPNPFNPSTTIAFTVAGRGPVEVAVYDLLGQRVATLVREEKAPGHYEVGFDATNLSSGIYLCRMTAGTFSETRVMTLIK